MTAQVGVTPLKVCDASEVRSAQSNLIISSSPYSDLKHGFNWGNYGNCTQDHRITEASKLERESMLIAHGEVALGRSTGAQI